MNLPATIANSLWSAANLPTYLRFRRALWHPEATQRQVLLTYLRSNAQTIFGRAHDFKSIRNYAEFARRVPLMDYEDLSPWIERIRIGESNLLTREPVSRLLPTSGSSGGRKLIPFTAGLQREFNAAIGPWLFDLMRQSPGIAGGPAYWSVTPARGEAGPEKSAVPIGFDADTEYLGGTRQRLVRAVMAVPDELRLIQNMEVFRYLTLLCLLRQSDLRLISVWHPSFLSLLLNVIPRNWRDLLTDIESGGCKYANVLPAGVSSALRLHPLPQRAKTLRAADPQRPETLWPDLKLISCWGEGSASFANARLKILFPNARFQPKGLLATEGFVTIPYSELHPVAVRSHFYEFIDGSGHVLPVHELKSGGTYEVVITTAGGLWRYRLRDSVEVNGFVGRTPSLRFLGRTGNVSDLFGEKLSETFATEAVQSVIATIDPVPSFVLLAPDEDAAGWRYTLYIEGPAPDRLAEKLDQALRGNPHYAYCRDLGQLLLVRLFPIAQDGYEVFMQRQRSQGARIGDIKPAIFSRQSGWSQFFHRAPGGDSVLGPAATITPRPSSYRPNP